MAATLDIPEDKDVFKIGEVAKLLDLEPYVLRYWETEFEQLSPDKTRSGQRVYTQEDIELLAHIQHLLHVEQYTIAGARRQLELRAEGLAAGEQVTTQDATLSLMPQVDEAAALAMQEQAAQLQAELDRWRAQYEALALEHGQLKVEREMSGKQVEELEATLAEKEREAELLGQKLQANLQEQSEQRERHQNIDARWELLSEQLNDNVANLEADNTQLRAQLEQEQALTREKLDELERLSQRLETLERLERELEATRLELSAVRSQQRQVKSQGDEQRRALVMAMRQELGRLKAPFAQSA